MGMQIMQTFIAGMHHLQKASATWQFDPVIRGSLCIE